MVMYLRRATPAEIERFSADPASAEPFFFPDEGEGNDAALIDFDKAWDALHFLLTEGATSGDHPLGLIAEKTPFIRTGPVGSFEFSIVTPERLAVFAAALAQVDDRTLRERYDAAAMAAAEVYLADDFLDEGSDALDYIMQSVPALRQWAADGAAAGDGALRVLS
ncbi:DUF1877 family protein [Sphingomonas sp. DT-51]|uniref:DUF1877 family protein n=1 Tax=Sphingomonas sp. DT-51 TaxID=3396165 RepID=UPI003F1AC0ED